MKKELLEAEFIRILTLSQLMDPADVSRAVTEFRALHTDSAQHTANNLAKCLVAKDRLTGWQANKLLSGRYKGFFFDRYKLLEDLVAHENFSTFMAFDPDRRQKVVIAVRPPSAAQLQSGKPAYRIVKVVN